MLQENSFFSRPLTYFGTYQNGSEDDDLDEEEWDFADPWRISTEADVSILLQQRIGLFIQFHSLKNSSALPPE